MKTELWKGWTAIIIPWRNWRASRLILLYRFKTQMQHVQNSEETLENKRKHCTIDWPPSLDLRVQARSADSVSYRYWSSEGFWECSRVIERAHESLKNKPARDNTCRWFLILTEITRFYHDNVIDIWIVSLLKSRTFWQRTTPEEPVFCVYIPAGGHV